MDPTSDPRWGSAVGLVVLIKEKDLVLYGKFQDLMRDFKRSTISLKTLAERAYNLIGAYPRLWAKFADFFPESCKDSLREQIRALESHRMAKVKAPSGFTADALSAIAKHLPLPSLARLSETCVWMRAQINPSVFDAALERARLTQGQFSLTGAGEFQIKNANEEAVAISPAGEGLLSLRVAIDGKRYVAELTGGFEEMASLLADVSTADEAMRRNTRIWCRSRGEGIEIFVAHDGQLVQSASFTCILP